MAETKQWYPEQTPRTYQEMLDQAIQLLKTHEFYEDYASSRHYYDARTAHTEARTWLQRIIWSGSRLRLQAGNKRVTFLRLQHPEPGAPSSGGGEIGAHQEQTFTHIVNLRQHHEEPRYALSTPDVKCVLPLDDVGYALRTDGTMEIEPIHGHFQDRIH